MSNQLTYQINKENLQDSDLRQSLIPSEYPSVRIENHNQIEHHSESQNSNDSSNNSQNIPQNEYPSQWKQGPFIICGSIELFQYFANDQTSRTDTSPKVHQMQPLIPCQYYYGYLDCYQFGYVVIGDIKKAPWINFVLDYVSAASQFDRFQQFKEVFKAIDGEEYNREYIKYFNDTSNQDIFYIGLVFCADTYMLLPRIDAPDQNIKVNCKQPNIQDNNITYNHGTPITTFKRSYFYTILYNNTWEIYETKDQQSTFSLARDDYLLTLKLLIDSALINYENIFFPKGVEEQQIIEQGLPFEEYLPFILNDSENKERFQYEQSYLGKFLKFNISHQSYPFPPSRYYKGFNIINQMGGFYFAAMPLLLFVMIQGEMVREKEKRIREGLSCIGVQASGFYFGWSLWVLILSTAITLLTQLSTTAIFRFQLFVDSPFIFIFLVYLLFSLSMLIFAFFISTLFSSTNSSYPFSYSFVMFALAIQLFLAKPDAVLPYLFSSSTPQSVAIPLLILLNLYTPFHFALLFTSISNYAGMHFDNNANYWVEGPGFSYSDIIEPLQGQNSQGINYSGPCPLQSILMMIADTLLYAFLTWYFDKIIASNNGAAQPWNFIFKMIKIGKKKVNIINEDQSSSALSFQESDDHQKGLKIMKVHKTFEQRSSIFKKPEYINAVKDVTLEVPINEVLGLLGQNGAGKTTLINMICGLVKQSKGKITIGGFDTLTDINKIRSQLGICPQFDILWEELRGREHLELFAVLKGIPKKNITDLAKESLKLVQLEDAGERIVKTYSGGMKRRLSLAMSCIGNVIVMLLDEPTTGMDPQNKREVWKLINKMRQNKSVILTTHSMEEADCLSDRIAIMKEGKIECVGTSLQLKETRGGGYKLTIISIDSSSNENDNDDHIKSICDFFLNELEGITVNKLIAEQIILNVNNKTTLQIIFSLFELAEQQEQPRVDKQNEISSITNELQQDSLKEENQNKKEIPQDILEKFEKFKLIKENILEWSISHATLEEVFFSVANDETLEDISEKVEEKKD